MEAGNSNRGIFMKNRRLFHWLLAAVAGLFIQTGAMAASSDIDFTSIISAKTSINGSTTVSVTLHGIEVELVVNEGTRIEVGGEEATFQDLSIDDFVKIEAFFADEGIVAQEIEVLDSQKEEFRVRGIVQATAADEADIILTVLNIDINVPPETEITRRGSRSGNDVPASELMVGDVVNIFGHYEDMSLVARRIHVGNRPQGLIELEGEITVLTLDGENNPASVTVLVGESTTALVLIDEDTYIGGELAQGVFVEVRGILDESLAVLGFEIIVDEDGDGDADDDNHRGRGHGKGLGKNDNKGGAGDDDDDDDSSGPEIEIEAATSLVAVSGDLNGKAKAKYKEEGDEIQQEFEVEIEDASAESSYSVEVVFGSTPVNFGTLATNSAGEGELKFSTSPEVGELNLAPLIPDGSDVRDITAVKVYDGGSLVLEGSF